MTPLPCWTYGRATKCSISELAGSQPKSQRRWVTAILAFTRTRRTAKYVLLTGEICRAFTHAHIGSCVFASIFPGPGGYSQ